MEKKAKQIRVSQAEFDDDRAKEAEEFNFMKIMLETTVKTRAGLSADPGDLPAQPGEARVQLSDPVREGYGERPSDQLAQAQDVTAQGHALLDDDRTMS